MATSALSSHNCSHCLYRHRKLMIVSCSHDLCSHCYLQAHNDNIDCPTCLYLSDNIDRPTCYLSNDTSGYASVCSPTPADRKQGIQNSGAIPCFMELKKRPRSGLKRVMKALTPGFLRKMRERSLEKSGRFYSAEMDFMEEDFMSALEDRVRTKIPTLDLRQGNQELESRGQYDRGPRDNGCSPPARPWYDAQDRYSDEQCLREEARAELEEVNNFMMNEQVLETYTPPPTSHNLYSTRPSPLAQPPAPTSIFYSPALHVLLAADRRHEVVHVFSDQGEYLTHFGGRGPNKGQFLGPYLVCCTGSGRVLVLDEPIHRTRLQILDVHGLYLGEISDLIHVSALSTHEETVCICDGGSIYTYNLTQGEQYIEGEITGRIVVMDTIISVAITGAKIFYTDGLTVRALHRRDMGADTMVTNGHVRKLAADGHGRLVVLYADHVTVYGHVFEERARTGHVPLMDITVLADDTVIGTGSDGWVMLFGSSQRRPEQVSEPDSGHLTMIDLHRDPN